MFISKEKMNKINSRLKGLEQMLEIVKQDVSDMNDNSIREIIKQQRRQDDHLTRIDRHIRFPEGSLNVDVIVGGIADLKYHHYEGAYTGEILLDENEKITGYNVKENRLRISIEKTAMGERYVNLKMVECFDGSDVRLRLAQCTDDKGLHKLAMIKI